MRKINTIADREAFGHRARLFDLYCLCRRACVCVCVCARAHACACLLPKPAVELSFCAAL